MIQIPIGAEDKLEGVVCLVRMRAFTFHGDNGNDIREGDIPADLVDIANEHREKLIDAASMFDDELAMTYLDGGEIDVEMLKRAVRAGVLQRALVPVFMGSAYKNKAVQLLLDGVKDYLPSPLDIGYHAFDVDNDESKVDLKPDPTLPFVGLAFKLQDGQYGQLVFVASQSDVLVPSEIADNLRMPRNTPIAELAAARNEFTRQRIQPHLLRGRLDIAQTEIRGHRPAVKLARAVAKGHRLAVHRHA
jgi:elongation factor G